MTIPIPPSVNHAYWYKGGKRIRKQPAKDFEKEIASMLLNCPKFPEKKKIVCNMWFYFGDNRRRDASNTLKIMLDSIERGGLYKDDKYVLPRIMDFYVDKTKPRVELEFYLKED